MSKLVSMRLDDDIVDIINAQHGKNFTEKFESLVRYCQRIYSSEKARADAEHERYEFYASNINKLDAQITWLKSAVRQTELVINDFENLKFEK